MQSKKKKAPRQAPTKMSGQARGKIKKPAATKVSEVKKEVIADKPKLVRSLAKHVRISPIKLRRVAREIRGKKVDEAMRILKFAPQKGARILEKSLKSAIANAVHNHKLSEQQLWIHALNINQGIVFKRFRARARGMVASIMKKTSHIEMIVEEGR